MLTDLFVTLFMIVSVCGLTDEVEEPMEFLFALPYISGVDAELSSLACYIYVCSLSNIHISVSAFGIYDSETIEYGSHDVPPLGTASFDYYRSETKFTDWGNIQVIQVVTTGRAIAYMSIIGTADAPSAGLVQSLPVNAWGKEYYVGNFNGCPFIILFAVERMKVIVTFRSVDIHTGKTINEYIRVGEHGPADLLDLSVLEIILNRHESFLMLFDDPSAYSVTGTKLVGTSKFGVITGNRLSSSIPNQAYTRDTAIDSLLPTKTAGRVFILCSSQTYPRGNGEFVVVLAIKDGTKVTFLEEKNSQHTSKDITLRAGNSYKHLFFKQNQTYDCCDIHPGQLGRITASRPVHVFQFTSSQVQAEAINYNLDFSMSLVIPVHLFHSYFYVRIPYLNVMAKKYPYNFISIIAESRMDYIITPEPKCSERKRSFSTVVNVYAEEMCLEQSATVYQIHSTDCAKRFMVYMSGGDTDKGYFSHLLSYYPVADCKISEDNQGDRIDNDCDGQIDEELTPDSDLDGDRKQGEDMCLQPFNDGAWGKWSPLLICNDSRCVKSAKRTCNNPLQTHGGLPCPGQGLYSFDMLLNESKFPCDSNRCYMDCSLSPRTSVCMACKYVCDGCEIINTQCATCDDGMREFNGTCIDCEIGYFGYACEYECITHCEDGSCDSVSGECKDERLHVWMFTIPLTLLALLLVYCIFQMYAEKEKDESVQE